MTYVKKISLYTCIILLITSLYNDIKKEPFNKKPIPSFEEKQQEIDARVVKVRTTRGETVLSISERINGKKLNEIKMENIIEDFETVNPEANPFQLKPDTYYYFPKY